MPLIRRNPWVAHEEESKRIDTPETLLERARDQFGLTTDFREAGFILPDGSMLDFSQNGGPHRDHSEIGFVFEERHRQYPNIGPRLEFELKTGAIRFSLLSDGDISIELMVEKSPTSTQWQRLGEAFKRARGMTMHSSPAINFDIMRIESKEEKGPRLVKVSDFVAGITFGGRVAYTASLSNNSPFVLSRIRRIYEDVKAGKPVAKEIDPKTRKWDFGTFKAHPLWMHQQESPEEYAVKPGDYLWRGTTTRFITPQGLLAHPLPPPRREPRLYMSEGEEDAAGYAPIIAEQEGGQPALAKIILDQQLFKELKPGFEGLGEWYVEREFIPRDRFTYHVLTAADRKRLAID